MVDKYKFTGERFFSFQDFSSPIPKLDKKESKKRIKANLKIIKKIQPKLFAEKKRSFLFVFQALDAAGKDGTIRAVFSGINPQGIQVTSFKKPTEEESQHDFLWRVHNKVPRKGMIGVFNRSHYEEVLVTRVHPEFIIYQNLPNISSVEDITDEFWQARFQRIKEFEQQLTDSGVVVVKFFLNVSFEEQKRRLLSRIENPKKHWKFNLTDFKERAHWQTYQHCFQDMINETATADCPWYVIPADDKSFMRALISVKIAEIMQSYDIDYPPYKGDFEADKLQALALLENE